jgi:hypothetical protein
LKKRLGVECPPLLLLLLFAGEFAVEEEEEVRNGEARNGEARNGDVQVLLYGEMAALHGDLGGRDGGALFAFEFGFEFEVPDANSV